MTSFEQTFPFLDLVSALLVVIAPDGRITSPEVPSGRGKALSIATYSNGVMIATADRALSDLGQVSSLDRMLALLPANKPGRPEPARLIVAQNINAAANPLAENPTAGMAQQRVEEQAQQLQVAQVAGNFSTQQQELRSDQEYNARVLQQVKFQGKPSKGKVVEKPLAQPEPAPPGGPPAASSLQEGVMVPFWAGDKLLLARRVTVGAKEYVQGCWLDWRAIRQDLMSEIGDLLSGADLVPAESGARNPAGRMLAGLPVRLEPGRIPDVLADGITPVQLSLLIAWCCVLLGAGAVGLLLVGAVSLSERRGAFVSAVTHELRTPLTTFRMYAEMLAEGMVTDAEKRRQYLTTLCAEAERLSHLVENVLSYARLERGRKGGHPEVLPVGEVVARVKDRLAQRSGQAGMNLVVEAGEAGSAQVLADPSVAEQILFNLVDNACKYAANANDKRIQVETSMEGKMAVIRVRDYGPGIGAEEMRRLFQPFSKSAKKAAETAPGVGLGLALSRRLARQMGGELRLCRSVADGACFELVIPLAQTHEPENGRWTTARERKEHKDGAWGGIPSPNGDS